MSNSYVTQNKLQIPNHAPLCLSDLSPLARTSHTGLSCSPMSSSLRAFACAFPSARAHSPSQLCCYSSRPFLQHLLLPLQPLDHCHITLLLLLWFSLSQMVFFVSFWSTPPFHIHSWGRDSALSTAESQSSEGLAPRGT